MESGGVERGRILNLEVTLPEFWRNLQKIHDLSKERADLSNIEPLDMSVVIRN